ncbi:hypothetical protein [Pseudacidobacterium ailaaui]|uniref:hypothetical protein n=1 Tax=Pseudacidobacterium ailaaui TaxID=1382359 RepID=UPI0012DF0C4A|nr:hypothetical protein [Pseudacidobacterium ailaaui]MBX6360782.1 hypothetical protein [Pseudacidobacterium ailaaui]MCL6463118.1 hypothetical protein [Pseudacidobacterium ailaaui]MDI3255304.1 hypothetical protein [Bacillota bacterium]
MKILFRFLLPAVVVCLSASSAFGAQNPFGPGDPCPLGHVSAGPGDPNPLGHMVPGPGDPNPLGHFTE